MNNVFVFLSKVEPFSQLPAEELQRLSLLSQVVTHVKGEVIYNEGDPAAYVWVLQEGRLEIVKYNSTGKPLAIEAIQPKQLFGTLCRIGQVDAAAYPCTAIAATKAVSVRIPDRFFQSVYNRFPAMVSSTCQLCSLRLGSLQSRAIGYQEPVQTRILRTLFQLQRTYGNELPYTKREISELAATTVETTIRILSALQKKRWIGSERGKILLREPVYLKSLLESTTHKGGSK